MRIKHAVIVAYGVIFIALSVNQTISGFGSRGRPIPFLGSIERLLSPLRSINRYGLFSVMTTRRPEITVEGSNDGENWHAYKFKWKPGALTKRPAFVAPHMPRLDWQMWFAALGNPHQNRWFAAFIQRLLEGEKPVLDLLAADPFPDRPPRYIRATLNEYTPADARTHATTGKWWTSRLSGTYVPPSSLTRDQ